MKHRAIQNKAKKKDYKEELLCIYSPFVWGPRHQFSSMHVREGNRIFEKNKCGASYLGLRPPLRATSGCLSPGTHFCSIFPKITPESYLVSMTNTQLGRCCPENKTTKRLDGSKGEAQCTNRPSSTG